MPKTKDLGTDKICPICGVQCMASEEVCECGYHFETGEISDVHVNKIASGGWTYAASAVIASIIYSFFSSMGFGGAIVYLALFICSQVACFAIRRNSVRKK